MGGWGAVEVRIIAGANGFLETASCSLESQFSINKVKLKFSYEGLIMKN